MKLILDTEKRTISEIPQEPVSAADIQGHWIIAPCLHDVGKTGSSFISYEVKEL